MRRYKSTMLQCYLNLIKQGENNKVQHLTLTLPHDESKQTLRRWNKRRRLCRRYWKTFPLMIVKMQSMYWINYQRLKADEFPKESWFTEVKRWEVHIWSIWSKNLTTSYNTNISPPRGWTLFLSEWNIPETSASNLHAREQFRKLKNHGQCS